MEETYSVAPEVVPAPTAAAPEVAPASGETPLTGLAAPGKATDKAPETAVDPKITEAENKLVEITGKKEEAYDTLNETTGLLADATKEAEKKTTEFTEADTKAKETEKKFNEKQAELAKNGDELLTQKQEVSKKSGEKQQAQAALDEAMKPEYAEEDIDEIRKTYEEAEKAEREAMRKELEIGDRRIILVNDVEKLKTENGTTQGELEKAKKAKESSDQNLEAADAENKLVSEDFNQLAREEMAAKNALEAAKNPTPAPAPTPEPTPAPTTDTPASSSPILDDFKASLKPKPLDYSVPPKE
jgi:chromosome segregation ATPase